MKIQTLDEKKRARIYWMRREEAQDEAVMTFLQNDFALQKEQSVLPVIVESGGGELEEALYLLMKRQTESDKAAFEKAS